MFETDIQKNCFYLGVYRTWLEIDINKAMRANCAKQKNMFQQIIGGDVLEEFQVYVGRLSIDAQLLLPLMPDLFVSVQNIQGYMKGVVQKFRVKYPADECYFQLGVKMYDCYDCIESTKNPGYILGKTTKDLKKLLAGFALQSLHIEHIMSLLKKKKQMAQNIFDDVVTYCIEGASIKPIAIPSSIHSRVDPTRIITDVIWVISLVRLPDNKNPQHAFLIVEAKEEDKSKMWFIDFVGPASASGTPSVGPGKIRFYLYQGKLDENLLFMCDRKMMQIQKGDHLLSTSWSVTQETGLRLINSIQEKIKAIKEGQSEAPQYNPLGCQSWLAIGSGASSSVATGHNCFTWAKQQLRSLQDPHIVLPADDIRSWIVSATSHFLVDDRPQQAQHWYQQPVPVATIAGAVAAGVTGFIVSNSDAIQDMCRVQ